MTLWRVAKLLGSAAAQVMCYSVAVCVVPAATAQNLPRTPQLVIAQLGNPAALDGWNWTATSEQDILAHMQESLMRYDREAKLQPLLAESLMFIPLPVANPLLADKRVRLALNLAVNKREIIDQLFRGIGAVELTAPMPLTLAERHPKLEGYPYDPARAQQLLKEAGAVGKTLTPEAPYNRYTLDRELGEAIAGYWEAVGLKVEYKPQDWASYSPRALRGSPAWPSNPFLMGFGDGRYLADYMYDLWLVKKPGGSRGAVYTRGPDQWDAWSREISLLGLQDPRRQALLYKLQEEIMDYAPWVLVLNFKDIYALNKRVDWKPFSNERRDMYDARPR